MGIDMTAEKTSHSAWNPPHIEPPVRASHGFRALRDAMDCVIRNWPREVYEGEFYRPPGPRLLMVMEETAIRRVLVDDSDSFPQANLTLRILKPVWRNGIAATSGDEWRWQRRAASPVFTPASVEAIVPFAEAAARRLVNRWGTINGAAVEITQDLADAVTHVVFDAFLASEEDAGARVAFSHWGDQLTRQMGQINLADMFQLPTWTRPLLGPTLKTPANELHKIVGNLLAARKNKSEGSKLLRLLASAIDPETGRAMSADRLRDNIVGSLAAGRETTALALSWALWLVAQHKPTQDKLKHEIVNAKLSGSLQASDLASIPFTRQVIMEAMRLYPPAPQIARQCLRDITLGPLNVRKGTVIILPIYALHRHRKYWSDPDSFDPDRFSSNRFDARAYRFRYLPFGGGPRICLGKHFALLEAQIMLVTLLRALSFTPAPDAPPVDFEVGSTLRPKGGLTIGIETG